MFVNTISPAIELPTFIEYDSKHQYFLVAAVNPSNLPKLNEINCGCGGFVPWFNTSNPMWKDKHNAGRAWANWVMAGGWSGDTLTDFDRSEQSTSTRMNGFALKIELGCDVGAILCSGTLDFTNDPLALSIAYAIYWKSLELLATKSLGSTKLTRTNLVNREFLQAERDKWSIKYEDNLRYIIQEASMSVNDCLVCRDESGLHIATARS